MSHKDYRDDNSGISIQLFSSARERRLWVLARVVVMAVVASAALARQQM